MTVTGFVFQPNNNTICSLSRPTPFAVNTPETVDEAPCTGFVGDTEAVSEVETGFDREPDLRVNRTVPGPLNVAIVGLFAFEHVISPEQVQLENVYPEGT